MCKKPKITPRRSAGGSPPTEYSNETFMASDAMPDARRKLRLLIWRCQQRLSSLVMSGDDLDFDLCGKETQRIARMRAFLDALAENQDVMYFKDKQELEQELAEVEAE